MASPESMAQLMRGDEMQFFTQLQSAGYTAEDIVWLKDQKVPLMRMREVMLEHRRLIHGRFTPIWDKIDMVKTWPGIDPKEVDRAVETARANGTIAGYEAESPKRRLLDLVITIYWETIRATVRYARARARQAHGDEYKERCSACEKPHNHDEYIRLTDGAEPFIPNRIVIEAVDFGSDWRLADDLTIVGDDQQAVAPRAASFAALYNAAQSPEWVRQMSPRDHCPYVIAGALVFNLPNSKQAYVLTVSKVWNTVIGAQLDTVSVHRQQRTYIVPVIRQYQRPGAAKE